MSTVNYKGKLIEIFQKHVGTTEQALPQFHVEAVASGFVCKISLRFHGQEKEIVGNIYPAKKAAEHAAARKAISQYSHLLNNKLLGTSQLALSSHAGGSVKASIHDTAAIDSNISNCSTSVPADIPESISNEHLHQSGSAKTTEESVASKEPMWKSVFILKYDSIIYPNGYVKPVFDTVPNPRGPGFICTLRAQIKDTIEEFVSSPKLSKKSAEHDSCMKALNRLTNAADIEILRDPNDEVFPIYMTPSGEQSNTGITIKNESQDIDWKKIFAAKYLKLKSKTGFEVPFYDTVAGSDGIGFVTTIRIVVGGVEESIASALQASRKLSEVDAAMKGYSFLLRIEENESRFPSLSDKAKQLFGSSPQRIKEEIDNYKEKVISMCNREHFLLSWTTCNVSQDCFKSTATLKINNVDNVFKGDIRLGIKQAEENVAKKVHNYLFNVVPAVTSTGESVIREFKCLDRITSIPIEGSSNYRISLSQFCSRNGMKQPTVSVKAFENKRRRITVEFSKETFSMDSMKSEAEIVNDLSRDILQKVTTIDYNISKLKENLFIPKFGKRKRDDIWGNESASRRISYIEDHVVKIVYENISSEYGKKPLFFYCLSCGNLICPATHVMFYFNNSVDMCLAIKPEYVNIYSDYNDQTRVPEESARTGAADMTEGKAIPCISPTEAVCNIQVSNDVRYTDHGSHVTGFQLSCAQDRFPITFALAVDGFREKRTMLCGGCNSGIGMEVIDAYPIPLFIFSRESLYLEDKMIPRGPTWHNEYYKPEYSTIEIS